MKWIICSWIQNISMFAMASVNVQTTFVLNNIVRLGNFVYFTICDFDIAMQYLWRKTEKRRRKSNGIFNCITFQSSLTSSFCIYLLFFRFDFCSYISIAQSICSILSLLLCWPPGIGYLLCCSFAYNIFIDCVVLSLLMKEKNLKTNYR